MENITATVTHYSSGIGPVRALKITAAEFIGISFIVRDGCNTARDGRYRHSVTSWPASTEYNRCLDPL